MSYRPTTRVFTPAATTTAVVTVGRMREHLRVTDDYEDGLIQDYSLAAQGYVERWTQRLLVRREAVLQLQDLPSAYCPIELPGGEVASITSVVVDGTPVTGTVAVGHSPALLFPATDWPVVVGEGYPVTITYQAGYTTVPMDLHAAIRLIASDLFEQRSNSGIANLLTIPTSAQMLMRQHRINPA